jgi:hypothetical protein
MRTTILLPTLAFVAATLVATPAFATGVAPSAATPAQKEQAQARFLRGKDLYSQSKYDAALTEFNASLDIVASPNARLYAARCLREMNKPAAAYAELGRTITEAREDPKYEKTADAAKEERAALESKLAFVDVSVSHAGPNTTLRVAGDEVRRPAWSEPVPVAPGSVDVVVETPGHPPVTNNVNVAAGEHKPLAVDAAADAPQPVVTKPEETTVEPSNSKNTMRTLAYVAGGVGIAGFLTFTIFGLKANSTYSDLQKACPNGPCPAGSHSTDISSGRTQQTVANVGLVFGILGAGAGVTLFILSSSKPSPSQPSAAVSVGPSYVGLKGAF